MKEEELSTNEKLAKGLEEQFKAIERKQMFFAGPLELKQGGLAIVGRLPVFKKDEFWGFVAVLIDFENLIDQSGLEDLASDQYLFQFSRKNPLTEKEEFFLKKDNLCKIGIDSFNIAYYQI